jgi:hypothetical protein
MKRCKCGMMIDFVKTFSGKKMPIEINNPVRVMVKTPDVIPETYYLTNAFVPHWINCPYSKEFKKK